MFALSAGKIRSLDETWNPADGAPVFTVEGRYQARGWTQWTQGFQFGASLLQFDATGDAAFLELGRAQTVERMSPHLTHIGVHDHGFNNVSTYGALWRLARERRIDASAVGSALLRAGAEGQRRGAGAALDGGSPHGGFIHSFNGAHSLFVDTIRSLRALALAHRLGQPLLSEQDAASSLLDRLIQHARATADYNVYYGRGRDTLRRARARGARKHVQRRERHYRGPSTQQGYSPFITWTRGLAWAMLGFAEQLEFLATLSDEELGRDGGRAAVERGCSRPRAPPATSISTTPPRPTACPYWDTGAPGLAALGDWAVAARRSVQRSRARGQLRRRDRRAGAAASWPRARPPRGEDGARYAAGGTARARQRCSTRPVPEHRPGAQGLLLHSIYHRPERLGPRAAGLAHSARRIEPVGRLPSARGRALRAAARERAALPGVLRPGRSDDHR